MVESQAWSPSLKMLGWEASLVSLGSDRVMWLTPEGPQWEASMKAPFRKALSPANTPRDVRTTSNSTCKRGLHSRACFFRNTFHTDLSPFAFFTCLTGSLTCFWKLRGCCFFWRQLSWAPSVPWFSSLGPWWYSLKMHLGFHRFTRNVISCSD